jgi:hypothetical protein
VIAVGRGDEPPAAPGLQVVRAHQPADLLAVDDDTLVAQCGADAAVAVGLELVADRNHAGDDRGILDLRYRRVVEGGARQTHQPAPLSVTERPRGR